MKKSEALGILGLSDGASDDEVKAAHRKLVIEHHPDKFAQDSTEYARAEEKTKLLNEARDVLLSRKWEPEFGRGSANPYASPYASPFVRPTGGGAGSPSEGQSGSGDPFEGWPFGQGQSSYVWTSWDSTRGTQPGQSYDPFGFTREPEITPEERFANAKQDLKREGIYIAAKLVFLALFMLLGSAATGLFVYLGASIVYGLWKRLGGCLYFLFIPLAIIAVPFMLLIAPWAGVVTFGLAIFFALAVLFDLVNIRNLVREYRAAKEAAPSKSGPSAG